MSQVNQGKWSARCEKGHWNTWEGPPSPIPPCSVCAEKTKAPKKPSDVAEALEIAEEILGLVDELPSEGEEFGDSVAAKAESIAANIKRNNRVTEGQINALRNMLDGVERWLE